MDDEVPEGARGGLIRGDYSYETPAGKVEKWSCVDYVDTIHEENRRATKRSDASRPGADGLQKRFGELDGHDAKREDGKGVCRETLAVAPDGLVLLPIHCDMGGRRQSAGTRVRGTYRWHRSKETNRGWPGTAEGKINTAQGMAGDLVGNLNNA